jgi:hypothetical protein
MLARLGRAYAERGRRRLGHDDVEGAWRDLLQAEQIGATNKTAEELRQSLSRTGLAEVRALLQMGEPGRAEESAARLRARGGRSGELSVLQEVIRGWLTARDLAAQGEFSRALESVERISKLLALPLDGLEKYRTELEKQRDGFPAVLIRLHEAIDAARWRDVIEVSEEILRIAPQHSDARQARARAWKAVEPNTLPYRTVEAPTVPTAPPPIQLSPRFYLWIDGVGGYLICHGHRVTIGQAGDDCRVDVPLIADVSRLHANLTRDAEGYVLEALRPTKVNGKPVTRCLLQNGDRITLGESCQLMFNQGVPVSASARLDLVSGQRMPLALDGVLLMADTLVLGSGPQSHILCPELIHPLVLCRQKNESNSDTEWLGIRSKGPLTINGEKYADRAVVKKHATIVTSAITFAVEPA